VTQEPLHRRRVEFAYQAQRHWAACKQYKSEEAMDEREEQIRRRAHELWEQEGKPGGREMDCWLRAEREIAGKEGETPKQLFPD
jgi:Protein of unknown function (DUF2934)